jgi:uncharacterized protein (TIGR03437 family)
MRSLRPLQSTLAALVSISLVTGQNAPEPPVKPQLHGLFTSSEGRRSARPAALPGGAVKPLATSSPVAGPTLTVDPAQGRHAISPGVYGINIYGLPSAAELGDLRIPLARCGGDGTSEYNWQNDKSNTAGDWYFEIFAQSTGKTPAFDPSTHNHSAFDRYHETNTQYGVKSWGTVPVLGMVAGNFPDKTCSYSVKKYGAQKATDPYAPDCGNGQRAGDGSAITDNDPADTDVPENTGMMQEWVEHAVARYGTAAQGGVYDWSLDNEPVWWSSVHQNVHPNASTYDEITNAGLSYAEAIKEADPTAMVSGPVTAGWDDLFFSRRDMNSGWSSPSPVNGGENWKPWNNPVDRKAHGDIDFIGYYLRQFANYEQVHGRRLLDYLEVHGYMPGLGANGTDDASNAKRLQSTRIFWDPSFILYGNSQFNADSDDYLLNANPQWNTPQCVCLIPRLKQWVNTYYPGTRLAITEYNLGNLNPNSTPLAPAQLPSYLNGALAEADVLGVFGREGVDVATLWGNAVVGDPVNYEFKLYRNYDGAGSAFGETSVSAVSSNQDQLAIYGAERSDSTLTLMVINKTASALSSTVTWSNFAPAASAQQWSYSAADLTKIVRGSDLTTTSTGVAAVFPANSMTLIVVPAEAPATRPAIGGVVNAATQQSAVAPGTLVFINGSGLGPAANVVAHRSVSGMVTTELSGVHVFVAGYAAPVYSANVSTIVTSIPYAVAGLSSADVVVEYRGARSDVYTVPLSTAAPGVFTVNGSGTGAALALDYGSGLLYPVLNSAANPSHSGRALSILVTGAGVLDPPAVTGRIGAPAGTAPVANVTVAIGGKSAANVTAVPAPGSLSGVLLVTVTVPDGAGAGAVPVVVRAGGVASPGGVTLALQ